MAMTVTGEKDKALKLYERSLGIREKAHGKKHAV